METPSGQLEMKLEYKVGIKAGITDLEKRPLRHIVAEMGAAEVGVGTE